LAAANLQDVAVRWEKISKDIGGVVTSVQFHDITRQRIEHARDALDAVLGNLTAARNGWGGVGTAADTCELQVAQLRHASDELVAAVEKIMKNLGDIAGNATEIAVETQAVAGIAGGDGEKSFLRELEKEISALIEALSDYIAMNRESVTALGRITATVGDMSVFVKEIDTIGIEMKMIALNACVHAAHIGEEGMALGVLANSIQQLSDETSRRITAVEENLRDIIATAGDLSDGDDDENFLKGRRVEALRALIQPLEELDGEIVSLAARIDRTGAALTEDIEKTISGITVHERIAGVIGDVSCDMEDVAAGLRASLPAGEHAAGKGQHLEKLAAMYTMQQERDVHSAVTVSQSAFSPGPIAADGDPEEKSDDARGHKTEEDMGDNVELF
jgi:methyl-accepting chemotaxis protein